MLRAERLRRSREHDRLRGERETTEDMQVCNLTQCDVPYTHADWLETENVTEIDVQ